MPTIDEIVNGLSYHRLDPDDVASADSMDDLREAAIYFARAIDTNCTDTRERSLAYTRLEESLMWAIKSIAIRM